MRLVPLPLRLETYCLKIPKRETIAPAAREIRGTSLKIKGGRYMQNRRASLTGASSVALMLVAFGRATPTRAQANCSVCKTTSLLLPLR